MTCPARNSLADGAISPVIRFVRLDLGEERAAVVAPSWTGSWG